MSRAPAEAMKSTYKLTEFGALPVEWDVALLDDVAERGSGHTPNKKHPEYWNGSIPWVSLKDSDALDRVLIEKTAETITPLGIANSSAVMHPSGTVVLCRDAGVGRSAIMSKDMAVSQHFMAWRCGPRLNNYFLYYWLQAHKREFERIAMGNTIKTIGLGYFRRMKIPVPQVQEQCAIAEALLDVDELLGALDRLIAKKRAMKQALLRQLLTGKIRLPGFMGAWDAKRLGDVASIRNNRVLPQEVKPETLCVELEHVGQGDGRLRERSTADETVSSKYRFEDGDVLFGRLRPYLKKYWLADCDGICTTEIWPLEVDEQLLDSGFLYALVQSQPFIEAASVSYGTHMPRADWKVLRDFRVRLPKLQEQAAIATVLSDVEAEVVALEHRSEKTRAIKQGMMQQLLTGRVRLVEPSVEGESAA